MTAVEPSERYAHPRNTALLRHLKQTAVMGKGDVYDLEDYELHTHPDLCDHLQKLNPACFGGAYGTPVLANDRGILFGVARGTSFLALLLTGMSRAEALEAGGRPFPEAGDDWIAVEPWRTPSDMLNRWCRMAHQYANSIKD